MKDASSILPGAVKADEILDYLYQKYFVQFRGHSEVTSSHWTSIGQQNAEKIDGGWNLSAVGFGNVVKPTRMNIAKTLPQQILIQGLLRHYKARPEHVKLAHTIAKNTGRLFDFDCAKQILSLDSILNHLYTNAAERIKTICVIGDGYGFMTSLLHWALPKSKVLCVNLGRTLLFDVYYTHLATKAELGLIHIADERETNLSQRSLCFLEAENYDWLEGMPIDLFINIASIQEMSHLVIKRYFELMRSSRSSVRYFYCCNRLEKKLPDGEVTNFMHYPWSSQDQLIIDELCPWYQKYPTNRPPFWRPFDGPTQHRLVKFA